jgi:hypothetical protein
MCTTAYKHNQKQKSHDHLDAKKAFDEIQNCVIIKALRKLGMERMFPNIIKDMYMITYSQY